MQHWVACICKKQQNCIKHISPGSPPAPPKKVKKLQAIYDYEPEDDEGDDMICLEEGDVVDILKEGKDIISSSYLGTQEK